MIHASGQESRSRRRRGIIAAFVAVSMIAITGVAAISVDGGLLYLELRRARATADAAAMGAACDLYYNFPKNNGLDQGGSAKQSALTVASSNGYTNDGTTSTVTVNIPPLSGAYMGQAGYAEVIVQYNVNPTFGRIFSTNPIPVTARAVSRGAWSAVKAGVLILNYTQKASLSTQGNGSFTEAGGPVIVNSNNSSAEVSTGNATMYAESFYVTGGVSISGGSSIQTAPVPGQIFTGTHPTPDPLAYLPAPTMPANGTMTTINNPTVQDLPPGMPSTLSSTITNYNHLYIMTPGTYTNLPTFTSGDLVIMDQASANSAGGIYYINGGGFKSTGADIMMDKQNTGGLMIYNQPASTSTSEKIQITGNGSGFVNLSPLTSGPYSGMMLWQDRNSPVPVLVEGNGTFTIDGTFYAAGALMNINGNGTTSTGYLDNSGNFVSGASAIGSQYVSNDLALGGNGNIKILYYNNHAAKTRIITLVE